VSRKENVAPAALQAALSWWALDALRTCVASIPNRACLAEAGALQALAAVLKAVLSRLHSMTAVLGGFINITYDGAARPVYAAGLASRHSFPIRALLRR
jgi:hypothetical protein